jgi:hypothetical protein
MPAKWPTRRRLQLAREAEKITDPSVMARATEQPNRCRNSADKGGVLILMMQTLGITTVSASVLRQLPPGK